jgi:hypothetical protein
MLAGPPLRNAATDCCCRCTNAGYVLISFLTCVPQCEASFVWPAREWQNAAG